MVLCCRSTDTPKEGEVIAVGSSSTVKVASKAIFKRAVEVLHVRGQAHALVKESDVLVCGDVEFEMPPGKILLRVLAQETVDSGIMLPKRSSHTFRGEVVAVGTDPLKGASRVKVGAHVTYGRYAEANVVDVDGVDHVVIEHDDVLLSYVGEPLLETLAVPRGRVLVRVLPTAETISGLLLSKGVQGGNVGEVVAVGPGLEGETDEPLDGIVLGDMLYFKYGDGVDLGNLDGKFLSVKHDNCLAKWTVR